MGIDIEGCDAANLGEGTNDDVEEGCRGFGTVALGVLMVNESVDRGMVFLGEGMMMGMRLG